MSRRPPAVLLALALVFAVAGCGETKEDVLGETAANLSRLRSAVIDLRLVAGPGPGATPPEAGFELAGPFALPEETGALPVADIDYTRISGTERSKLTFISTGTKAFVDTGTLTLRVSSDRVHELLGDDPGAGLRRLHLDRWVDDPEVSDGPTVDGVATDRVRGRVRVVDGLNDLFAAARSLGAQNVPGAIAGARARALEQAVRASSADITTGKDDRMLRTMRLTVDLDRTRLRQLRASLGSLARAHVVLDLELSKPNRPVEVKEPRALPVPFGD